MGKAGNFRVEGGVLNEKGKFDSNPATQACFSFIKRHCDDRKEILFHTKGGETPEITEQLVKIINLITPCEIIEPDFNKLKPEYKLNDNWGKHLDTLYNNQIGIITQKSTVWIKYKLLLSYKHNLILLNFFRSLWYMPRDTGKSRRHLFQNAKFFKGLFKFDVEKHDPMSFLLTLWDNCLHKKRVFTTEEFNHSNVTAKSIKTGLTVEEFLREANDERYKQSTDGWSSDHKITTQAKIICH